MTAQMRDRLIYEGKEYYIATDILRPYLQEHQIYFVPPHTACWRGYVGEWAVVDNKLYLTNLEAYVGDMFGRVFNEVGLGYLFPNEEKVFAKWFTGVVRIPHGKMIRYIHQGYASIYEKELYLEFVSGILVNYQEKDNNIEELDKHSGDDL